MGYELRLPGRAPALFETEEAAMEAAKVALREDADAEPEVFDTATGQPCAPGASKAWREALKREVGF